MLVDKKKSRASEIPTSSLADIAFLLLVFFLVTTTIDVDKGIGLALPPKGETQEVNKKNISNILINSQGEVMLDDAPTPVHAIKRLVQAKLAANDLLTISVKSDPNTNYNIFIQVLDQLKQAKASRISLAEPDY